MLALVIIIIAWVIYILYVAGHAYIGYRIFIGKGRSGIAGLTIGVALAVITAIGVVIPIIILAALHFFLPNKNSEKFKNTGYGAYEGNKESGGYVPQPGIRGNSNYGPPPVRTPSRSAGGDDSKARRKEADLLYKEGLIDKAEYDRMRSSIR